MYALRHRFEQHQLKDLEDNEEFFNDFLKEGSNRGVITDSDNLRKVSSNLNHHPPWSLLKEKIISDFKGFWLRKNSFMYQPMNRKVVQFFESGIASHEVSKYRYIKKFEDDSGPKVLTLEHLDAGFYIWLVCIAAATLVFILELCFKKAISAVNLVFRIPVSLRF